MNRGVKEAVEEFWDELEDPSVGGNLRKLLDAVVEAAKAAGALEQREADRKRAEAFELKPFVRRVPVDRIDRVRRILGAMPPPPAGLRSDDMRILAEELSIALRELEAEGGGSR